MFGHQDDNSQPQGAQQTAQRPYQQQTNQQIPDRGNSAPGNGYDPNYQQPAQQPYPANDQSVNPPQALLDEQANDGLPQDDTYAQTSGLSDTAISDPAPTSNDADTPVNTSEPAQPADVTVDTDAVGVGANDLLDIKQQALQQLSPLVGQLDQSAEEKFRTIMMMIQASDDQNLIKAAYDTAQSIPDEKVRAQALLDIINEINYFTQHSQE